MSTKVIGIDLASSQSVVAVINEVGKPEVIVNEEGRRLTPSVVMITPDERKIGASAQRQAVTKPKNTVSLIKRFMGGSYASDDIQKAIKYATFNVDNVNGKPYVNIDGKQYSPEEISSYIVSYLKKQAENYYGQEVTKAVITCPAFYGDAQRQAVKLAGELAGLEVLRVINEPTAAVLAATNLDLSKDKKILVVDLGGSTLDFSLCDVSSMDGQEIVEILSSYGNTYLGGADFDKKLVDYICDEFAKDHSGFDLRKDPMAYTRIVEAAERAKCELSTATTTEVNLPYITVIDNVPQMLVQTITRATYEKLTADLIDEMIRCGRECLSRVDFNPSDLDEILLVGGMTRSVNVQEALSKEFKCPLNKSVNPDEAVALGAATQANVLVGGEGAKDILLLDVTPLSVGIETEGKLMTVMVEANTTIPTSKSQVFTTAADNQPSVFIKVLQGERQFSADNKVIGTFELGGIMPARRGVPQIEVTFSLDANGILTVSAKDKGTGKENSITIKDSNSMSPEEIERIKADAERFKEEDAKKKAEVDKLNACESFAYQVRNSVEDEAVKELVTEDEKKVINEKVDAITEAVKAQNGDKAEELRKELENYFNPIAQRIYQQQASAQAEQPSSQPEQPQDNAQPEAEDVTFEEVK
jgi:molecular chaperone DnaK